MAADYGDGLIEIWTQPIEWDAYTTPEHCNPDIAEFYCRRHWGKSVQDVQEQIAKLRLPWVELPTIEPYDEKEANHLLMLKIGAPMLPGFT